MFQTEQSRQLAERLQVLKSRTNRSYEVLSRWVGVSSSTLHRYCRGEVVPPTHEVIVRFCQVCGATRTEAEEVLRYWALAVNHRQPEPRQGRSRWWYAAVALVGALAGVAWHRLTR